MSNPCNWSVGDLFRIFVSDSTEFGALVCDREGLITYWNEGAERIFGYRSEEMAGKRACEFFTPEDVELRIPQDEGKKAVRDGTAVDERWHQRKDGTRFWASGVTTCIRDENGQILGFSKFFRNLSLRKQTEDEIRSANAELAVFVHTAAHDLKEPVRNICTLLGLLDRRHRPVGGSEADALVTNLVQAAQRMQTLVDDLLSLATEGRKTEHLQLADGNAAFDSAVGNLSTLISESQASVSRCVLPSIIANPSQFERLLRNLIANAIKFRGQNSPRISVNATSQGENWLFSVHDNGIGIPQSHHTKIFEAFQRLHSQQERPGSGLGLALCKKIVENHGGKIWVESEPGKGSTFFFSLPKRH
ncbi:PAS domain S-box protein [bacterium]|nr:PAS domain S-box protein [bacterium]